MNTKEKGIGYWLPIILGIVALLGVIAKGSVRLDSVERKANRITAVEWDAALIKSFAHGLRPTLFDSVLNDQIKQYGPRPVEEK